MKIGLINGSPKPLGSTSEVLLDELKTLLPGEHELLSLGHGQKKNLAQPLSTFVNNLLDRTSGENLYVNPTYPRFAILQGANHDWTKQGKAHGLKKKDLVIAP